MNVTNNGITLLMEVIEAAKQVAPVDVAEWFESAIEDYIYFDVDLEVALELKTGNGGQEKARTQWRRWQRNEGLRKAFSHIHQGINAWQRTEELRRQISRFESMVWPKYLDLVEPPAEWSSLRRSLFRAMKNGPVPRSTRGLWEIVANPPC